MNIFRGEGLTLVTKPDGEFVTLLESGTGKDKTGIRMVPGQLALPGMWPGEFVTPPQSGTGMDTATLSPGQLTLPGM
jgi:hypothetical protein